MSMTLRLSQAETQALRDTAERERRSMQEVARTAIHLYVTQRSRLRDEALARIAAEDAGLLDRLAKA